MPWSRRKHEEQRRRWIGIIRPLGRGGTKKVAIFVIGFVLGGAVVGGAIYLSDTQDDSTSGPIE